ncbi:DUF1501 domain-containing protein [Chryseolinea lacunae]|uniref:DUF1501 domain-containing protein n=1 Tax=Chryseolinea lacunae TaxID=2801331 RepID=A0ABS1KWG2_9BACT|nr:DUF1501 domain-containing protein [Chryseolinea lacunae]MBL0743800.1 DUF1501 domain-containing protein [Chryseolinea lacunae]
MNKSRRDFLKKFPLAMSIPFAIGGIPIRVLGESTSLARMAAASGNDRVLIILQMHGGNDGLNCLIPVEKYDEYHSRRANIAIPAKNSLRKYIPLDTTLPADVQVGLHPDMLAMKGMYDQGRVAFVQGVSYKNNNGSHFRGRDIWFMGGSADDYYQSGWVGRYLESEFAPKKYPEDFPNPEMPDPLAIEMGSDVSLIFHQQGNIPTSISINDPESFAKLVGELEGFVDEEVDPRGLPPDYLKGSPYYKELDWILSLEDKSKDYAQRLAEVYKKGGATSVTYPENYPFNAPKGSLKNPLSSQLKVVAQLLAGGCQTKVFLVKIGGFDSHADQVEKYDTTMGGHAALMYHISTAMSAFQEDLRTRGMEERVLTVTTSEFGRRIQSNGSFGTDHGTGGPMFIFGRGVQPGVVGTVPDLSKGNVEMQYDYRLIYGNIMKDWMLVDDTRLNEIFPGLMTSTGTTDGVTFQTLPLAQQTITSTESFIGDRFALGECYPNPAKDKTSLWFKLNSTYQVNVDLMNDQGKVVKTMVNGVYEPGEHKVEIELTGLPVGHYIYQFKTGFYKESKKLVIIK